MRVPGVRAKAGCRALAVVVCVPLAAVLVAAGAPAPHLASPIVPAALPSAVPAATPPRIAFTDAEDEDDLAVERGDFAKVLGPQRVTHAGETSVNGKGASASVSTMDEPHGEVYYSIPDGSSSVRVTCDSAVESHPVVSPDGTRVAYASNASGTFRLWLGMVADTDPEPEPHLGSVPSCQGRPLTELAGAPGGENLWPGWVGDDRLVFSGTGADPLGDIWVVDVGSAAAPAYDAPATRLTDSPAAETQPSHGWVRQTESAGGVPVVVLTTTQFRPDGSLGYVELPQPEASPGPTPSGPPATLSVRSLWKDGAQQSTEGVWSPDGTRIAYTTTERDSYGDVMWASVAQSADVSLQLHGSSVTRISDEPGSAESHPAWLPPPGEEGDQEWRYTVRTATGDVTDVVAADGTGRRTIANESLDLALDESTPTYSPDGSRIAYSRTAPLTDGREIVMADSDGGALVVLDTKRPAGSVDVEPTWSPDGTQIAFVRFPECDCSVSPSEIWVADVETRTSRQVTRAPENTVYWDENPSWSPDGTRLVIARSVEHLQPDLVVSFAGPRTVGAGESIDVEATVTNHGRGTANGVVLQLTGPDVGGDVSPRLTLEPVVEECDPAVENALACRLDSLSTGAATTVTFRIEGQDAGEATVTAVVLITGSPGESDTTNNTAAWTIDVTTPPDIEVTAAPTAFRDLSSEAPVTITFTIRNSGSLPATGVTLVVASAGVGSPPGEVSVSPAEGEERCEDEDATFACDLATIEGGDSTEVAVVVSPERAVGVEVTGTVEPVVGEVNPGNNVTTVNGSVCCQIGSAIPSALLARVPVARTANAPSPTVVREVPDASPDDQESTLWVIDASTGAGHELAGPGPQTCVCPEVIPGRGPAWSPDGLMVAYEQQGSVRVLHLADQHGDAVALRSGTDHPLIDVVTGFSAWSDTAATPTPSRAVISVAEDPAWSPDGEQLAIAAQPAGQPDQRGIYRIQPDGTGLMVVAQGRGPETEPAWQPFTDLEVTLIVVPGVVLLGTGSTLSAKVTNSGPSRATDVSLELTVPAGLSVTSVPATCTQSPPGVLSCDLGAVPPSGSVVVDLPVSGTALGTHVARADVGSPVPDPDATNNTASATVEVTLVPPTTDVAVTVRMDPDPGYVGGTGTLRVEITNSATGSATGIQVTINYPATIVTLTGTPTCFTGSACSIGSLAPGGRRTLTAPVRFKAAGSGALTAAVTSTVDDTTAGNDRVTRTVTVKQPAVRILQPIGTPGSIAMAVGEEFPPGSRILLTWDHGLNQREISVVAASDGSMPPTQVLIFRRDQIGTRLLLATPQDPTQYTVVSTPMLVTPRTVTPPADFVSRN